MHRNAGMGGTGVGGAGVEGAGGTTAEPESRVGRLRRLAAMIESVCGTPITTFAAGHEDGIRAAGVSDALRPGNHAEPDRGIAPDADGRSVIASSLLPTGWSAVDDRLGGGLLRGAIHEWFGLDDAPPLCILAHLARQAVRPAHDADGGAGMSPCGAGPGGDLPGGAVVPGERAPPGVIVWIGRRLWPHPRLLVQHDPLAPGALPDCGLLARSLFVDPPDRALHLWVIDVSLRSGAAAAVIADGAGLRMAETRRLQLAAETAGAPALLARPPDELKRLSAAATRWRVSRRPDARAAPQHAGAGTSAPRPQWSIELLRNKRSPLAGDGQRAWSLEWEDATCRVRLSPDVVGGPRQAAPSSESPSPIDVESSTGSAAAGRMRRTA